MIALSSFWSEVIVLLTSTGNQGIDFVKHEEDLTIKQIVAQSIYRENGGKVSGEAEFDISVPDITGWDNANLAMGVQRIVNAFTPLNDAKLISGKELIWMVYRFVGEVEPEEGG
jgi:hypothetical protein